MLEVTDYEAAINLLLCLKYTLILADTGFQIITTPDSTSFVFCETKVPIQDIG